LPLQAGRRGLGVIGAHGAAEQQATAGTDRRAGTGMASGGAEQSAGYRAHAGANHGAANRRLVGRLLRRAIAGLRRGVLPAARVIRLELLERFARPGYDECMRPGGRCRGAGAQNQDAGECGESSHACHMSIIPPAEPPRRPFR